MLKGIYRYHGKVDDLPIVRELAEAANGAVQLNVEGSLAITSGTPPAAARSDRVSCVLDGYLYEGAELARMLELDVASDAELIAQGYRRHGDKLLTKLRGRFACALWDSKRRRGVLSCDLLSTQPLFLWRGVGYLAFASELTDLLSMLPSTPGPDPDIFLRWLGGTTVPVDRTLYEGITRLPPGQLVDLSPDAPTRSYWRPRYTGTIEGSPQELAEGLLVEIERAVGRRLSVGSQGVVLSGGVDSSIVTAVASRVQQSDSTLRTYSCVFPGADYDEGWKVRSLTGALGVEPDLFEIEPRGSLWLNLAHIKHSGLPLTGCGALIEAAMVTAASKDGIEVVLDGQTGDEVFGAAPWLVADRLMHGRVLAALELTRRWPRQPPTCWQDQLTILKQWGLKGMPPHRLHRLMRRRKDPEDLSESWLLPAHRRRYGELDDQWAWKAYGAGPRWWRYQADRLIGAPHRELRLDYLRTRASSAGVLSETPLYDVDLIDYCLRLPPQLAFDAALDRPLAREAVRGLIPDDVRLHGEKANFSPLCFDIVTGADAPVIERLFAAPDAELGAYADMSRVRRLWREERPRQNSGLGPTIWGTVVWRLAVLESWLRSQSDSGFVDEMLARPDVPAPRIRRAGEGEYIAPF